MADKLKVIRKRDSFYDEKGNLVQKFPSITQAKRHSRLMQSAGRWEVSVDRSEDPKPKPRRDRGDAADRFIAQAIRKEQAERIAKAQEARKKKGPNTLTLAGPLGKLVQDELKRKEQA
jgi:hypothetical protein